MPIGQADAIEQVVFHVLHAAGAPESHARQIHPSAFIRHP